jgi:hypothetical protein
MCKFDDRSRIQSLDPYVIYSVDVDADGRDEILVATQASILVFRTDRTGVQFPWLRFQRPFVTHSTTFGWSVQDVGNVASPKYHSLLVTDPEASDVNNFNGAIFLYNIGAGLDTHCVAWHSSGGFEDYFGTQACKIGDADSDGFDDFLVARNADIILGADHIGEVTCYRGSAQYASPVGVREYGQSPTKLDLSSPFPNPAREWADVRIGVRGASGSEVELTLYDMLGRNVGDVFRGIVDGFGYTLRVPVASLATGMYALVLKCGSGIAKQKLSVVH